MSVGGWVGGGQGWEPPPQTKSQRGLPRAGANPEPPLDFLPSFFPSPPCFTRRPHLRGWPGPLRKPLLEGVQGQAEAPRWRRRWPPLPCPAHTRVGPDAANACKSRSLREKEEPGRGSSRPRESPFLASFKKREGGRERKERGKKEKRKKGNVEAP